MPGAIIILISFGLLLGASLLLRQWRLKVLERRYLLNQYDICSLNAMSSRQKLRFIRARPTIIQYLENPSRTIQRAAVEKFGYVIEYLPDPNIDIQLLAVNSCGKAIEYIKNPSKAVQIAAVSNDADALQFIINPDRDVLMEGIRRSSRAIRYAKNPDSEMILLASAGESFYIGLLETPDVDTQYKVLCSRHGLRAYECYREKFDLEALALRYPQFVNRLKMLLTLDLEYCLFYEHINRCVETCEGTVSLENFNLSFQV